MDNISMRGDFNGNFKVIEGKKSSRIGCFSFIVVLLVILIGAIKDPAITYQWFLHDVRHPEVFTKRYQVESGLFFSAFVLTLALLWFNLLEAVKLSSGFVTNADSRGVAVVAALLNFFRESGRGATRVVAGILAIILAGGFGANWNNYLLASHAQTFGQKDPLFGLDLGFFMFKLPWYKDLANYAFGTLLFTVVLTVGVYVGLQALASLAKIELSKPKIRQHISVLVGATIIVMAIRLGLNCFEFGLVDGEQFTGAGYAAVRELAVQEFVVGLVALLGVVVIIGGWAGQPFKLLAYGGGLTLVVSIIGTGIYPAIMQRVSALNKIAAETPYAARAIKFTRLGFSLDDIKVKDFAVTDNPAPTDIAAAKTTFDNMRLWDPGILRSALDQTQGFRPYYSFNDVDVDRYMIGGRQQMVMVSSRDMLLSGLQPSAATWLNTKLYYTHGYGVAMVPVNTATAMGDPDYLIKDMPVTATTEIPVKRPQIYFSNFQGNGGDEYSLVHTKIEEFDYPSTDGDKTSRWEGDRGIPVGGLWERLIFSIAFGDGNLLFSGNITSETKLLMHKDVLDRAQLLYPFLDFDPDPYLVVLDGKFVWILDGYTSSDKMPYSEHQSFGGKAVNYIRNPVKAVVDAYTGDIDAYAIDPNEPILKCWREVFPTLIKDKSAMPKGLEAHLRYPESMFMMQSAALTQYHVTEPTTFLTNGDAWDLPLNRGSNGEKAPLAAYNVQMRLPDEPKEGFMLIMPFTPRQKQNMSGWLAAHCDPADYGKLILYKFTKGSLVPGPEQMETAFNQDAAVGLVNRNFNNDQNQVMVGNLLVIPIGSSMMYAEPLFFKSRTAGLQARPELKKVILAFNGRIVIGENYADALQKLIGTQSTAPTTTTAVPTKGAPAPKTITASEAALAKEALDLMDQADQALRGGDFAKYGEIQKKLKGRLQQIVGQ